MAIDLDHLAYDVANFAHSSWEPTSIDAIIRGPRPYYYCWTEKEGMDILTFTDPSKPETAKLFRYSHRQIRKGADLANDKPKLTGKEVVRFLREYLKK